MNLEAEPHSQTPDDRVEQEQYIDRSFDHVARVRAAKEAAQRQMETFGDVSEYDVTIIHGQLKKEPVSGPQAPLEFGNEAADEHQEEE